MVEKLTGEEREFVLSTIRFALGHKCFLPWKRNTEHERSAAADRLLEHLELANIGLLRGPPLRPHSSPGDDSGYALTGNPFSWRPAWTAVVRGARR